MTAIADRLAAPSLAGAVARWRAAFRTAVARRQAYEQTMFELSRLTPRELDDLGIMRADIRRLARETAYGA